MRVGRRCRPSSTLATTNCRSTTRPSWKRSRASSEDMLNKWAPATAALCRRFFAGRATGGALPRRQATPLRWTQFRLRRLPASTAQAGRPLGGRNYRRRLPRPQSLQRRAARPLDRAGTLLPRRQAAPPLDRAGSFLQRRSSVLPMPIRLLRPSPRQRQRELALPLQREATLPLQRPAGLSAKRASAAPATPSCRGSTRSCGSTSGNASPLQKPRVHRCQHRIQARRCQRKPMSARGQRVVAHTPST